MILLTVMTNKSKPNQLAGNHVYPIRPNSQMHHDRSYNLS